MNELYRFSLTFVCIIDAPNTIFLITTYFAKQPRSLLEKREKEVAEEDRKKEEDRQIRIAEIQEEVTNIMAERRARRNRTRNNPEDDLSEEDEEDVDFV